MAMIVLKSSEKKNYFINETNIFYEKNTEERFGSFNGNNDQEIFLMANEKGDIQDIYNMNDAQSKHIIETRNKVISDAGTIEHADLPDVQMNMQMQATQEFRQNMRKR